METKPSEDRQIQRTRTTKPPIEKQKPPRTTPTPKKSEAGGSVWKSAMAELSDKISRMGSGIHRIDLDQMLDLDLISMQQEDEEDQKSSNSYLSGTTALPAQDRYDSNESKPKRQALHPKLTFQRPEFSDVHRPSMNLKDMINKRMDIHDAPPQVRTLPTLIPRYQEEALYQPTSAPSYQDECPYIPRRPDHECYNAPPNECQAAGHPDPSCPTGSLCCYDGCINLCWRSPHPPPKLPPMAPPPAHYAPHAYTTPQPQPQPHAFSTPQPRPHTYSTPQPPPHTYSTPQPPPHTYSTPQPPPHTYSTPQPHTYSTPHPPAVSHSTPRPHHGSTLSPHLEESHLKNSGPTHKSVHPPTSKDPLFYEAAPPDFLPKIGPDPVLQSTGPHPPSDYHVETNPLLPPSLPRYKAPNYVPATNYRSTPKPQYSPAIPQYKVKTSFLAIFLPSHFQAPYLPPLENNDGVHHPQEHHVPVHQVI